jgi:hypothetical protein
VLEIDGGVVSGSAFAVMPPAAFERAGR